LSREFMIFCGAMLLAATAVVITVGTSSPILGKLFREAPSTVPIDFYNKWTLPLAILFVFLAGLGQLFWWNKMSVENVNRVLLRPIALSVACTIGVLVFTPFVESTIQATGTSTPTNGSVQAGLLGGLEQFWGAYGGGLLMLLLVFVTFFALFGNGLVLWRVGRGNPRLAGGATAHVGLAIMVLGIIASSGFSNALGRGAGVQIGENRDNFVLNRGETRVVDGYKVTYSGRESSSEGRPVYVLDFEDPMGRAFRVKPVVYKSSQDQWIQHPDHEIYPEKDIFVAVSPSAMFDASGEQGAEKEGEMTISRGDSVVLGHNEFALQFVAYDTKVDPSILPDSVEIAVAALLDMTHLGTGEKRRLSPVYLIMKDRSQQFVMNRVEDWDVAVTFTGMNVDNGSISLFLEGVDVAPEDWLVVQAYEKPFISLLWFGFLMLTGGMGLSAFRRFSDARRVAPREYM
ncbi:MAG: cytochrome c-type biogenesis CcmF C-terminal domain-containing protein, partial [Rhodothermales bacterium]